VPAGLMPGRCDETLSIGVLTLVSAITAYDTVNGPDQCGRVGQPFQVIEPRPCEASSS
jgi:hypothetical protein